MSALQLLQNVSAIGIGNSTFFAASGGTPPYTFSISNSGAGGTINPYTGQYVAPYSLISTPQTSIDVVTVTDSVSATASAPITVGGVLELICDIIQNYLSIPSDHLYLWDQKINMPTDSNLYVAVSMMTCKPFGNNSTYVTVPSGPTTNLFAFRTYANHAAPNTSPFNTYSSFNSSYNWNSYAQTANGSLAAVQVVNMQGIVDIDIISRGPAARDQKELVVLALQSTYSEQQQEANSFMIGRLPWGGQFTNLSQIDGAAIPYRYRISFAVTYAIRNQVAAPYFTQFNKPQVVVNA